MQARIYALAILFVMGCGQAGVGGTGGSSAGGVTGGSSAGATGSGANGSSAGGTGATVGGATAGGATAGGATAGGATAGGATAGGTTAGGTTAGGATAGTSSGSGSGCAADQYDNNVGVCTPLTVCDTTTQYEGHAPTATTDRVCFSLTVCGSNAFQTTAPTPTTNRVCQGLTTCLNTEYQSVAPTSTSDRSCTALTACTAQQYQSTAPTATSNRACAALAVCDGTQYESTAPTPASDRQCTALTVCDSSQYQSTAPTATSNRTCSAISPPCDTTTYYQFAAPTTTSDRVCALLTVCSSSQYQSTAPTGTSNRACTALTVCDPSTQFETVAPTTTSDRGCQNLTQCTSAQCESVAPTATSDRHCVAQTLVITPSAMQVLVSVQNQAQSSVTFTATICGADVNAAWSIDKGSLGTFDSNNTPSPTFASTGKIGGLGNIVAGFNGVTNKVQVLVQLSGGQNGATSAESAQVATTVASLTAGGGIGGVGGEGLGGALAANNANYVALQATPSASGSAKGFKFLYPYDGTVWPRGMLAPLLQWNTSDGDADAVRIDLYTTTGSYAWTGYFARPAILSQVNAANNHFIRHPIPQDVWDSATNTAGELTAGGVQDQLTVAVTLSKAGVAYGPISETWGVARARLSGTIYYQSYGTNLAANYGPGAAQGSSDGAIDTNNSTGKAVGGKTAFGAAVLSIRGGDPTPKLVSSSTACQVCHSVAAKGGTATRPSGRLLTQAGGSGANASVDYELPSSGAATSSALTNGLPADGYPGLYPDGTLMLTPSSGLQTLPNNNSTLSVTGLPSGNLGVPAFSPDGTKVVFNPQATPQQLVMMSFDVTSNTFSNKTVITNDSPASSQIRPAWPQFFPDSSKVVYQHELRVSADGNQYAARTRKFARSQIYWASANASAAATPLNKLNGLNSNGTSYLPSAAAASTVSCTADGLAVGANAAVSDGDPAHLLDANYNYEPTVNPVSSGGYAWVVFTSRRMYGNEATIPPFCSDPRGLDLQADFSTSAYTNITTKKLWVAAIDINGNVTTDASHPAFYLPAQELLAGNARGFWVLDPCVTDGLSCATGDQCCGGYCEPNGSGGALVCSNTLPNGQCSPLQGKCSQPTDCCDAGALCVNAFCATQSL